MTETQEISDETIEKIVEEFEEEKYIEAIKNYYKERPCRDCRPGNGCDDCRDCEDGKRNWEMWNEVKKLKDFQEELDDFIHATYVA